MKNGVEAFFVRLLRVAVVVIGIAGTLSGCSTHAKRLALPRTLFYEGQLQSCREHLDKLQKGNRHDRDVANLDLAVVDLLEGQTQRAETRLKEVRDRFDYLEQESMTEKTVSRWTDDSVRSYAGEDYEKILIRVYLALANLMGGGGDAESYTLQIQEKHEAIMQRLWGDAENAPTEEASNHTQSGVPSLKIQPAAATATRYRGLPLGFYMRGMLREETHQHYDDALRSYTRASELLPDCMPLRWDISRVQSSVHSQPGCGVIYVFAMVGRGPYKVETVERPTSDALLIADRIVSAVGPYQLPPTIAPIKVPDVVIPPSDINTVGVRVDGQLIGPTASLADIEELAVSTFRADRNRIVARAVARRVIKKATVAAAKQGMSSDGLTSLGMDVAGIAWEATESADTRCWGLLPRDIQVLRVETTSGIRSVQLSPCLSGIPLGPSRKIDIPVTDGRNTYVICWFPDARSPGQVLCSQGIVAPANAR